jgi:hypothetical protein
LRACTNNQICYIQLHSTTLLLGGKMKPIAELIKQYGTQRKLADAMGVNQGQVSSWLRYGALVESDGAVWVKRRDGVDGLGLFGEGTA